LNSIEPLQTNHKHLKLYIYEDILFVWSQTTTSLYTFRQHFAALFFILEEEYEREARLSKPTDEVQTTIYKLLTNTEDTTDYTPEKLYLIEPLLSTAHAKEENIYRLYNTHFSLYIDESVRTYLEPSFTHLLATQRGTTIPYHFKVLQVNGSYKISVNNTHLDTAHKKENILPILQDFIRIVLYENSDFLVALHAAVLEKNSKTLILPGISGSGKSTLSSFLMLKDYSLYSDEVAVISTNYTLSSLALCNTLKEGSWSTIHPLYPQLDALTTHHRFDGQKIKFVPPKLVKTDSISALGAYIIFPTYAKDSSTLLKPIGIVQAIELLKAAQYHLYNPQDEEVTKSFLNFLVSAKLYTIHYSDLQSAKKAIEGVLKDD